MAYVFTFYTAIVRFHLQVIRRRPGAKPWRDRAENVRKLCDHRAVSAAAHRNSEDTVRRPCSFRSDTARRSYQGCAIVVLFWAFVCVPNVSHF